MCDPSPGTPPPPPPKSLGDLGPRVLDSSLRTYRLKPTAWAPSFWAPVTKSCGPQGTSEVSPYDLGALPGLVWGPMFRGGSSVGCRGFSTVGTQYFSHEDAWGPWGTGLGAQGSPGQEPVADNALGKASLGSGIVGPHPASLP